MFWWFAPFSPQTVLGQCRWKMLPNERCESFFTSPVSLSGRHKPWHADEGGGASRLPLARHGTGQQFPAAVCGRRSVEWGEGGNRVRDEDDAKHCTSKCHTWFLILVLQTKLAHQKTSEMFGLPFLYFELSLLTFQIIATTGGSSDDHGHCARRFWLHAGLWGSGLGSLHI